ncbi:hypothetical protein [Arthrobacter sp. NicSoilB11]|uniref:hypothetical protein n=1 Tax=Arthrobacter sp. NicSoilB11 TaxID=2830999 RepID=UPI001CC6F457|nr:hypothetical protein [Arthrobacter sp. NicSoilB11]BCW77725.1 hypothetical protein NicSoilB11_40500 [Arthrobacter sp. NicSoilB11]
MMDLAGVLAAAVLLITLVTLEVRRLGPGRSTTAPSTGSSTGSSTGQPAAAPVLHSQSRNSRIVVGVMWAAFLLLLFPRVLGLLT